MYQRNGSYNTGIEMLTINYGVGMRESVSKQFMLRQEVKAETRNTWGG